MKVAIFTQFYPPEMEPSGFMFHSLAKHLSNSPDIEEVDVICGFANFPSGKFIDRKWYAIFSSKKEGKVNVHNVIVVPSNNKSNIKRIINYVSYLFTSFIRGLFLKSPDIIVATSPPIFAALSGLLVAKIKGAKFALDVRDVWPESAVQMGSIKNKYIVMFLEWLEKFLYTHSTLITVATPGMIDIVKSKLPNLNTPVVYIPCGVTIPEQKATIESGLDPFAVADDEFTVLYAGLHGYAQNLTTLVDAAKIVSNNDKIKFFFIGDGPDKDRVVKYAEELNLKNIKFLDPVPREMIRRYFVFAKCAVVPLQDIMIFKNVFPSKTFELMSYGVPSIVGVGGEIGNVIETSGAGISVQPENPESYAAAILKYANDEQYRKRVKENAIATAKKDFDYDVINKNYETLLINILKS